MKLIRFFNYTAGGILLAAALLRFLVAFGGAQALALPEPMLGIPLRYAVLLVGGFELTAALTCLFGRHLGLQIGWVAWAATNFAVYWVGLVTMHCHPQAACIGSLTDPLHLSRGTIGIVVGCLPVYLLLGSYAALLWFRVGDPMGSYSVKVWHRFGDPVGNYTVLAWRRFGDSMGKSTASVWHRFGYPVLERRRRARLEFIKMACPACGVHIRFASHSLGRKISCPQCQTTITLRQPALLKMSCFFCQEHIMFPSHAIGEKMPCPHCNMDITLKEPA